MAVVGQKKGGNGCNTWPMASTDQLSVFYGIGHLEWNVSRAVVFDLMEQNDLRCRDGECIFCRRTSRRTPIGGAVCDSVAAVSKSVQPHNRVSDLLRKPPGFPSTKILYDLA